MSGYGFNPTSREGVATASDVRRQRAAEASRRRSQLQRESQFNVSRGVYLSDQEQAEINKYLGVQNLLNFVSDIEANPSIVAYEAVIDYLYEHPDDWSNMTDRLVKEAVQDYADAYLSAAAEAGVTDVNSYWRRINAAVNRLLAQNPNFTNSVVNDFIRQMSEPY